MCIYLFFNLRTILQRKSHLCIPFLGIARPQSQFPCVCERFIYSQDQSTHIWLQQNRQTDPWKYINLSQIYECRNWETEHYNSVLEIKEAAQFHFWEYKNGKTRHLYWILTGPSHLQCIPAVYDHQVVTNTTLMCGGCVCIALSASSLVLPLPPPLQPPERPPPPPHSFSKNTYM